MARPESARNNHDLGAMEAICPKEPATPTMTQVNTTTTQVRSAVATSESVVLMPHLASTDTMPANSAEAKAAAIQACITNAP